MVYDNIRKVLTEYYFDKLPQLVEAHRQKVFSVMDQYAAEHPAASSYFLKAKLYEVIADNVTPMVFDDIPFCFELGTLMAYSDGKFNRGAEHANGWLIHRNMHLYEDVDPENYALYKNNLGFFVQCGTYADYLHLGIPMKKLFGIGLSGILDELEAAMKKCVTLEEREFITCATVGIQALHKISLKLSAAAAEKGLNELADIAARVPFEAPKTFHEGLCVLAFIRKALGSLEGYGFSSIGRPDVLLAKLYESDKARGVTDEQMLDLVSRFLLIWDCTNDRRHIFDGSYLYELENTLTLGGCDENGNVVFNGVTKLFLTARDMQRCMYPKMMLRFSASSPEEYLRMISKPLTEGRSYSLYENDDVMIPALVGCGTELKDARNYIIGGCWDALTPDTNNKFSGEYSSLVSPFLNLIKENKERFDIAGIEYRPIANAESFEELYANYIATIDDVVQNKARLVNRGSQVWHRVNPACALSALMETCIDMRKDMTAGGIKYSRECIYFTCFAEVTDSLFAIKKLCFDEKVCTLSEIIAQCKNNWGNEELRQKVLAVPSYGDGSEEASRFARRFYDDLCEIAVKAPTAYGGLNRPGFNLYTEIVRIGAQTGALPNGRKEGDFLSQGITPSRLQKECSLYDLLDSLRYFDFKKTSGNSSITLTLPAGKINEEQMAALFRVFARNGLQAIQPNCVSREELLAAKADPENHKDIIVRVCGFSAPFVCLAERYQDEILSRNISDL